MRGGKNSWRYLIARMTAVQSRTAPRAAGSLRAGPPWPERTGDEVAQGHQHHQVADPIGPLVGPVRDERDGPESLESLSGGRDRRNGSPWADERARVKHYDDVEQGQAGQAPSSGLGEDVGSHEAMASRALERRRFRVPTRLSA